jgi:acyl carrier protein
MTRDRLVTALRDQLTEYLYFGAAPAPIEADEDLFELGLDSQGVTRIVAWLSAKAGVTVPPEAITTDNFRTIDALADLVTSGA